MVIGGGWGAERRTFTSIEVPISTSNRHSELAARSCTTGAAVVDEVGTEDGPAWTMLAAVWYWGWDTHLGG